MSNMGAVLLAGAGAEADLGFCTGADYTLDTFFTKKAGLYGALRTFYEARMKFWPDDARRPLRYESLFLFSNAGGPFIKLLNNVLPDCSEELQKYMGTQLRGKTYEDLTQEDKSLLFNRLIEENESIAKGEAAMSFVGKAVEGAHYGILEPYFSSILNPSGRSGHFWKLVNFYWSAFFCIALPVLDSWPKLQGMDWSKRYSFVLENLPEALSYIYSQEVIDKIVRGSRDSYCALLQEYFDAVITTNYTPFSSLMSRRGEGEKKEAIYLAGCLRWFEDPLKLEVFDALDNPGALNEGPVFPFMMAQAPVKPIISTRQLTEYSKAVQCLSETDTLCVLGYSFTDNDGHVIALARDFLANPKKETKLVYFAYIEEGEAAGEKKDLLEKLRLTNCGMDQRVEVVPIRIDGRTSSNVVKEWLEKSGLIS